MKISQRLMKSFFSKTKNYILCLFAFTITGFSLAQSPGNETGWYLSDYSFKDGSGKYDKVLAGTSSKMYDKISYEGEKGNIEITQNRYDEKTGKLLAGVTYKTIWSNPSGFLKPGEKVTIDYELKTIYSLQWKPQQQTVYLNQGQGVYFVASDGTKFITKDLKSTLTSDKSIEKGSQGAKRTIQVTLGTGFSATYTYEWREGKPSENVSEDGNGWKFVSYLFKDGTGTYEKVLAGTSSKMYDKISFEGDKGDLLINQNRYDEKTGKLIAGVTYKVKWSDPPGLLKPGEKVSIDYELETISSLTWKPQQQTVYLNQGQGVYFIAPDGTKFITKDMKAKLTTEKVIEKGSKGLKRTIQVSLGTGFSAIYSYEWQEF